MDLSQPVEQAFRITPRQKSALARIGIRTAQDVLFHFPSRYESLGGLKQIRDLAEGEKASVIAEVVGLKAEKTWKKKIRVAEGIVRDTTGTLGVVWFNQPYIANILKPGMRARFSGKISRRKGGLVITNPSFEPVGEDEIVYAAGDTLLPVYPESYGITSRWFRYQIRRLLPALGPMPDPLPPEVLAKYHLPSLDRATRAIHAPKTLGEAEASRKRFSFEEIFYIQLARQRDRKRLEQEPAFRIPTDTELVERFAASLPFPLTGAQERVIRQILDDFGKPHPMARLLEGDVGSGKTLVAAAAALNAVAQGYQVAYMAPTEILARQHFDEFIKRLAAFKVRIGLLTGSEGKKFPSKVNPIAATHIAKSQLLKWCLAGDVQILIGTHALIEDRVKFKKLGFVVVDEQHRFGVRQRAELAARGFTQMETQMRADSREYHEFLFEDLTYQIRGAVFAVANALGLGLKENIYMKALAEEFRRRGIHVEAEKVINLSYRSKPVGFYRPDFVVDDKVLVELKASSFLGSSEERQLWTYLKGSPYRVALLVNFGTSKLEIKRVVYDTARQHQRKSASYQRLSAATLSRPHYLSMTATPIPRTLALTMYGDLDLSVLDEMPPGREPVETRVIGPGERAATYAFIREEVRRGGQVFVICPKIEELDTNTRMNTNDTNGDLRRSASYPRTSASQQKLEWNEVKSVKAEFKKLAEEIFPDLRVGMVHGKLLPKEKEGVMKKFKDHELDILVSTSVIEVGVDMPNASIMMIEGGERFGLAQLHQFRGRVGRGPRKSYCLVFTTDGGETRRLKALKEAKTGFELAEYDLAFRGPGELSGRKQWGISDVGMDALKNIKMVEAARSEAQAIVARDAELAGYPLLRERVSEINQTLHFE